LSKQFRGAALFFIRKIEVVAEQRVAARFAKRTRHGSVCKQAPRHFDGDADLGATQPPGVIRQRIARKTGLRAAIPAPALLTG